MTAPAGFRGALPPGVRRVTVKVSGDSWEQSFVLPVVESHEWRIALTPGRVDAVAVSLAVASAGDVAAHVERVNAAPAAVKQSMQVWRRDRRLNLSKMAASDLDAANIELGRLVRGVELDEGAAVEPAVAASVVDTARSQDVVTVPSPTVAPSRSFADMSLPELVDEARAYGLEGVFEDRDELVELLEVAEAMEEASA